MCLVTSLLSETETDDGAAAGNGSNASAGSDKRADKKGFTTHRAHSSAAQHTELRLMKHSMLSPEFYEHLFSVVNSVEDGYGTDYMSLLSDDNHCNEGSFSSCTEKRRIRIEIEWTSH